MKEASKKVFVGISGGVDSSVSTALLKEQGYDVTGVFIKVWQPPFLECSIKDDRRDAMRVCAQLEIPFVECDAEEAYKTKVIDYMISEYKSGRTPNPDVMCNKYVKFGVFFDWAMQYGADYVATGHYAQTVGGKLFKAKDNSKDQSYFLWQIGGEKLSKTLFPIGNLEKSEVRELAKKFGLFTANKKDSQGLCFLGKLNVKDFLKNFIESKKGNVLNKNGDVIGEHDGAFFFTLGERHGFHIYEKTPNDSPYYVIGKDIDKNTITVDHRSENSSDNSGNEYITLKQNVIYNHDSLISNENKFVVYRYHGEENKIKNIKINSNSIEVELDVAKNDIAKGQSMAIYNEKELLAAGIIDMI